VLSRRAQSKVFFPARVSPIFFFPARSAGQSEGVALLRDPPEKLRAAHEKSVTRLCRYESLLSNQSNKWDGLQQVRLSARGGLAQFCPQGLMSRGVSN
jgi:hypothetical protein